MKKKIIASLGVLAILGTSLAFMTACGNTEQSKELVERLDASVSAVTSNENFNKKQYYFNEDLYEFYAPKYNGIMEVLLKSYTEKVIKNPTDATNTLLVNYAKTAFNTIQSIGSDYDITFGYAFNSILNSQGVIKNNYDKINQSASEIPELIKKLDNFAQATKDHSMVIKNMNDYLKSINSYTDDLAENALYNYAKDYEGYVRTTIDLARELYNSIEDICPMVSYREQTNSQLNEDVVMNFSKINIKAGSRATVVSVSGVKNKIYTLQYIDKNNVAWQFIADGDYGEAKEKDVITLNKDVTISGTYLGRSVVKGSRVKVVEVLSDAFYKVEFTDSDNVVWTKTLSTEGKYINTTVQLNKEYSLAKDVVFDLSGKILEKGSAVTKIGTGTIGEQTVRFIDSNNYVWETDIDFSKVEVVPENENSEKKYLLKENTLFSYTGLNVSKNTSVAVADDNYSTVNVSYAQDNGYIWLKNISKSKLTTKEISYFEGLSLETLNEYFTINVEKMGSKMLSSEELSLLNENDNLISLLQWKVDCYKFLKQATDMQNVVVKKELTLKDFQDLDSKHSIYEFNKNKNAENLKNFDLTNIRFFSDWEMNTDEKVQFEKIQNYYDNLLETWVNYYISVL